MDIGWAEWLVRLAVAAVLGGLVGFEREAAQKAAGLRTNMLVGLGAALFAILSIDAFNGGDPSRIAAGVVTGVGFLGAGAIFRRGADVRGLTTAASLWAVAAIGLAAGSGEMVGAVIATALALVILYVLRAIERLLQTKASRQGVVIEVRMRDLAGVGRLLKLADRVDPEAEVTRFAAGEGAGGVLALRVRPDRAERLDSLAHTIEQVETTRRVDA